MFVATVGRGSFVMLVVVVELINVDIFELLLDVISHGIQCLVVHLDSQLVVLQLNGQYRVCDPSILQKYLRVKLLEKQFEFITYIHIPRSENQLSDSLANFVLNWHITHQTSR